VDIRRFRVRRFWFWGLIFIDGFSGSDTRNVTVLVLISICTRGSLLEPEILSPLIAKLTTLNI
jgi:hypothetical protein